MSRGWKKSKISKIEKKIWNFNPFDKKIGFWLVISCLKYRAHFGSGKNFNFRVANYSTNFLRQKPNSGKLRNSWGKGLKLWIFSNPSEWPLKRRRLKGWSFFINIFLYLSSPEVEKIAKNHNYEISNSEFRFFAFISRYRLDRYRNILMKSDQQTKLRRMV